MRRSLTAVVTLAVIGTLLLPATSNIAANALPYRWQPYLWLAWPIGMVLAVPMIYFEVRKTRHPEEYLDAAADHGARSALAAHDLAEAVRRQWTKEAGLRSLHSPEPIRVRWSSTGRPVAADLSKVLAPDAVAGRPLRTRGDIRQVVDVFRQVKARQLVILGAPAAGKSVLALFLTLDLLSDEPVPVLLAISSWNPHREDLHGWVARRIVEDYPALANSRRYGPDAVRRLLDGGRVVPVLDGLDEMSAGLQPVALDAIDRAIVDHYPLVVTCRSTEYRGAIARNNRFLAHAAVLEIQPVAIDDAAAFLEGADPRPERWRPILDHLAVDPDGPLARTLRSPLMIDLTRTIYTAAGARPAELCDDKRFPDQGGIERHLFTSFLRVAYDSRSTAPGSTLIRYSADGAGDWLRFLAVHLNRLGEHNLAWWQVESILSRPIRGLVLGVTAGLAFGITNGLFFGAVSGLVVAAIFFVTVGFAGGFGRTRKLSRIRVRFRGNEGPLLLRIVTGIALGAAYIPLLGMLGGVFISFLYIVAFTTHMWMDDPSDEASAASPMSILGQDRGAALVLGGVLATLFGPMNSLAASGLFSDVSSAPRYGTAALALSVTIAAAANALMGGFLYGRAGAIAIAFSGAGIEWVGLTIDAPALTHKAALAGMCLYGLMVGGLAVLTRAWGFFVLTSLYLALRGRLPLRLMRFLDDAHQRGILRQAGTTYQFRHRALQEWLANPAPSINVRSRPMKTPAR